jgi:non-ribosomal peptide synthetase component F
MSIGCIYVPLNPADPVERLAYLINDINAPIILTQTHLTEKVHSAIKVAASDSKDNSIGGANVATKKAILLDSASSNPPSSQRALIVPLIPLLSNCTCITIFTSGSTGRPKGVQLSHSNILNHIQGHLNSKLLSSDSIMLQYSSCTFDVHLLEILGPLCTASRIVLLPPGGHYDLQGIIDRISNHRITTVHLVPSVATAILDLLVNNKLAKEKILAVFKSIETFGLGGEELKPTLGS